MWKHDVQTRPFVLGKGEAFGKIFHIYSKDDLSTFDRFLA
jgi:hypothetical protein